jgi:hypothetical protein
MTVEDLLQLTDVEPGLYTQVLLCWAHTKNGQPAVLLKRSPAEAFINNYNATLMRAWKANLDMQCLMYVGSYISKPEKTLGDLLKAVSSSGQNLSRKESMSKVAKKLFLYLFS